MYPAFSKKYTIFLDPAVASGDGSKDAPFSSLADAFADATQKLSTDEDNVKITFSFADGVYRLTEPVKLSSKDFTAKTYAFDFSGSGNAVINGATVIPNASFEKVTGKDYYRAQLAKKENGEYPEFRDLYVNGKLCTLATYGREHVMACSIPFDKDRKAHPENLAWQKLYIDPAVVAGIDADNPSPLEIWMKVEWQLHAVRIARLDYNDTFLAEDGTKMIAAIVNEEDWSHFYHQFWATLKGRYYWGKNALTYLHDGQFFYDRQNGVLYYQPSEGVDMTTAEIAYPNCETLIELEGLKNVTFTGLAFTGTTSNYINQNGYIAGQAGAIKKNNIGYLTDSAIKGTNLKEFTVKECRFYQLGGDGINTRGRSEGFRIFGNRFETIAMTAIRIGAPDGVYQVSTNANVNIEILNNYIYNTGAIYKSNVSVFIGPVFNLRINYNTFIDSSYSAVSVGWRWGRANWEFGETVNVTNAEIAYNYLENFMSEMKDGGAIYTLGGNCTQDYTELFNSIHDNYCAVGNTTGQRTGCYTVLYHDGSSSNWYTYDNVIEIRPDNPSKFSYISFQNVGSQQVYNITAENNYFINLNDPVYAVGAGRVKPEYNLHEIDSHIGVTYGTLDDFAKNVILNAGCDGAKATLK